MTRSVDQLIHAGLLRLPRVGPGLAAFYLKIFSWVNYGLVALVGVGINFLVMAIALNYMAWWIADGLAIFTAWSWNWANSVGPLGSLWGFRKNGKETIKTRRSS